MNIIQIIAQGDMKELQRELRHRPQALHECDQDGRAALHHACIAGSIKIAKDLVDKGVNVNQKADGGTTPLHIACYQGYTKIALMLIRQGARLHAKTLKGYSPFLLACHNGHISLALNLIQVGANLNDHDMYGVSALGSYGDGTDKSLDLIEEEILLLKKAYTFEAMRSSKHYESGSFLAVPATCHW